MKTDYSSQTDLKQRYGGILENPYVSKIHRHCLDGFKVRGLSRILKDFQFENILDVGCGLGEYSTMNKGRFTGLDNSFPRVRFAQNWFKKSHFCQADATRLPFKDNSFEAVLLANTIHHLTDEQFLTGLQEMKRVSRRYIIIDDCVKWQSQNRLSQFFYSLDRGTMFRSSQQIKQMVEQTGQFNILLNDSHMTFPGLYVHAVMLLEIKS